MLLNRHHCQESCAVVAWRCWAWSLLMTSLLLSMSSNSWRPVHRRIMRYECCVACTDWTIRGSAACLSCHRRCSSDIRSQCMAWLHQGIRSSAHQFSDGPCPTPTARQIHQLLRNCAIAYCTWWFLQKSSPVPGPSAAPTTSTVFYFITTLQPQTSCPLSAVTWTSNATIRL